MEIVSLAEVKTPSAISIADEEGWEHDHNAMLSQSGMKTRKREAEVCGEMVPSYFQAERRERDQSKKKRLKGVLITLLEEEGEEEGTMDSIVGLMNNPLIRNRFEYYFLG